MFRLKTRDLLWLMVLMVLSGCGQAVEDTNTRGILTIPRTLNTACLRSLTSCGQSTGWTRMHKCGS